MRVLCFCAYVPTTRYVCSLFLCLRAYYKLCVFFVFVLTCLRDVWFCAYLPTTRYVYSLFCAYMPTQNKKEHGWPTVGNASGKHAMYDLQFRL